MEERELLYGGLNQGLSLREIGRRLGRDHTSLSDELKNNKTGLGKRSNEYLIFEYLPCRAAAKAAKRALRQRQKAPLKKPLIWLYVREHLRTPFHWTPEQIAGRLPIDHPGERINTETIYRYIYSKKARQYKLWECLPQARKKRMKKGGRSVHRESKIPGAISIDLRPEEANSRISLGHWETDNVVGKTTDKTALSTTVERTLLLTLVNKLISRSARAKTDSLTNRLLEFPEKLRKTLTADNGAENSYHQEITKATGAVVYFCHAYHSWEKGTNENTNGRLRRYIPKGLSIDEITEDQVKEVERRLNSTPRKKLGYLTPYEKMNEALS